MAGDEPETDEETLQAAVQACIETVVLQKASGPQTRGSQCGVRCAVLTSECGCAQELRPARAGRVPQGDHEQGQGGQ
eukprot:3931108-Rhodomonas_salina.1